MKVFKVLMFFTPTSDPHPPYYFLHEENIDDYIDNILNSYENSHYEIEEQEYDSIDKIPIYPLDA